MVKIIVFLTFWSLLMVLVSGSGNLIPGAWQGFVELPATVLQIVLVFQLLAKRPLTLLQPGEKPTRAEILFCSGLLLTLIALRFQDLPSLFGFWRDACTSAMLLLVATLLGTWLVKGLQRPTELILVCLVMACTDGLSVLTGPTGQLMQDVASFYQTGASGPPPLGDFLLVKFAVPGSALLSPVFGVSDWIMVSFLTAAAQRFELQDDLLPNLSWRLPLALLGLVLAVITARLSGWMLPALPLVALVFIGGVSFRQSLLQHMSRREWRWICSIGGIALSVSLWLWISGPTI